METVSLPFSPLSLAAFSFKPSSHSQKLQFFGYGRKSTRPFLATRRNASSSHSSFESGSYGHLLVDENMIVLRKRIHEMKMKERNYEPPSHWMEWEKQYYTCYDEFICQFVGYLQTQLMNSRPSLALGMIFLVTLSVPISTVVVGSRLMELANGVFSAICG